MQNPVFAIAGLASKTLPQAPRPAPVASAPIAPVAVQATNERSLHMLGAETPPERTYEEAFVAYEGARAGVVRSTWLGRLAAAVGVLGLAAWGTRRGWFSSSTKL